MLLKFLHFHLFKPVRVVRGCVDFQLGHGQPLVHKEALAVDDVEGLEVQDNLGEDALVGLDGPGVVFRPVHLGLGHIREHLGAVSERTFTQEDSVGERTMWARGQCGRDKSCQDW